MVVFVNIEKAFWVNKHIPGKSINRRVTYQSDWMVLFEWSNQVEVCHQNIQYGVA